MCTYHCPQYKVGLRSRFTPDFAKLPDVILGRIAEELALDNSSGGVLLLS